MKKTTKTPKTTAATKRCKKLNNSKLKRQTRILEYSGNWIKSDSALIKGLVSSYSMDNLLTKY